MTTQITKEVDIRQYANAEQLEVFTQPITDFFGMQLLLLDREFDLRRKVVDSLERSLTEHADVWAELA